MSKYAQYKIYQPSIKALSSGSFHCYIFYNIHIILFVYIIMHTRNTLKYIVVEHICIHVKFSSREIKLHVEEFVKMLHHGLYARETW